MASVFQKKVTRPIPDGATRFEKNDVVYVRWQVKCKGKGDGKTETRVGKLTIGKHGDERVVCKVGTFIAKYRDAAGSVRVVSTGCRDESAARAKLTELVRREEMIRGGVITAEEAAVADHKATLIVDHVADYVLSLQAAGRTQKHIDSIERQIDRIVADCEFVMLGDIRREKMERWLVHRQHENMSARTRNSYVQSVRGFLTWCVQVERLIFNPLSRVVKADEKSDRRKHRRAMTEDELSRLLLVARDRPLAEKGRQTIATDKRPGKRSSWTYAL